MAVLGIGGLFFRARDPETLSNWYRDHLNVGSGCVAPDAGEADDMCWTAQGGPVVFAPFNADTDYFPTDKAYMLNLRVSDMAELIDRLKDAGIDVIFTAIMCRPSAVAGVPYIAVRSTSWHRSGNDAARALICALIAARFG